MGEVQDDHIITASRALSWRCSAWGMPECGQMYMFVGLRTGVGHYCRKQEESSESEMLQKLPQQFRLHGGFSG